MGEVEPLDDAGRRATDAVTSRILHRPRVVAAMVVEDEVAPAVGKADLFTGVVGDPVIGIITLCGIQARPRPEYRMHHHQGAASSGRQLPVMQIHRPRLAAAGVGARRR